MWRQMMRALLHPASSAATTKSSSRSERNRPRTSRPSVVQPMKARMMVMAKKTCSGRQSCGRAAVITSQIGMVGSDCSSSMRRWMTWSIHPPRYPEMPPRKRPRRTLSATEARLTVSEVRVPYIIRDHWSRPSRSVPSRCSHGSDAGSAGPTRWTSDVRGPSTL